MLVRGGKKFMMDESKQKLYQVMQVTDVILRRPTLTVFSRLELVRMTLEWSNWRRMLSTSTPTLSTS